MSKVDLKSREWCELVFEGRNKAYGAYDMRAKSGRRHLYALIDIVVGIIAIGALILGAIEAKEAFTNLEEGQEATELSELQKEVEKKPEKKEIIKEEPKVEEAPKVAVKNSIQFTVPDIVDVVEETKKLLNQEDLQKSTAAVSTTTVEDGVDWGINAEDVKAGVEMSDHDAVVAPPPPKPVEVDAGSQAVVEEDAQVYTVVEQPAQFPGGEAALLKYIGTHMKYPQIAQEQEIQGVVTLRFVVSQDGSIGDVQVVKGLESHCDAEAVRVVKSLPRFTPAKQQGKTVKSWFTLPIRFQLQ